MAQFVLRIEQRQRHEVERVGVTQAGDDAIEQFAQRVRAQQLDFARLGLAQQQLVARDFFGERPQALAQFFFRARVTDRASARSRTPLGDCPPVFEIFAPAPHERCERLEILGDHRGAQPLHGLRQRLERLGAVIVEALDFEIQLRALLRHAATPRRAANRTWSTTASRGGARLRRFRPAP